MVGFPSLNRIKVGRVLAVTDEMTLYFSAILGDRATSIFPNFRFLLAYLQVKTIGNELSVRYDL